MEKDSELADSYFKRVSERYRSISEGNIVSGNQKAQRKFYASLDPVDDPETEENIRRFSESQFNLGAYHENYFLPISHRTNGDYPNRTHSEHDPKSTETEFQFSVRIDYEMSLGQES